MNKNDYLILGLGETGLSCIRFLYDKNVSITIFDDNKQEQYINLIKPSYPKVRWFDINNYEKELENVGVIIKSPGIFSTHHLLSRVKNIPIIGDIELFARYVQSSSIIGITGTNGKSTVTTMVGEMFSQLSQVQTAFGGNLGVPALDLINEKNQCYVLELSSFQLDTTSSLNYNVACILNVSPDHMDRYNNFSDYVIAKQKIYDLAKIVVYNRDDLNTYPQKNTPTISFGLDQPLNNKEFGLIFDGNTYWLSQGNKKILASTDLQIFGKHNWSNALASLAIGYAFGLPMEGMIGYLKYFKALPHRCQLVRELNGVFWFNDSKGTNIAATVATIQGLSDNNKKNIILIAGGQGKGQNFELLNGPISKHVKIIILIGQDAQQIARTILNSTVLFFADTMEDAVQIANKHAQSNDIVLLSPFCASLDMFDNFSHRGEVFKNAVMNLV